MAAMTRKLVPAFADTWSKVRHQTTQTANDSSSDLSVSHKTG